MNWRPNSALTSVIRKYEFFLPASLTNNIRENKIYAFDIGEGEQGLCQNSIALLR
jgi:hypothetical protein